MAHKLSDSELATILHALRMFQIERIGEDEDGCDHFEDCQPLTNPEIDDLCELINLDCYIVEAEAMEHLRLGMETLKALVSHPVNPRFYLSEAARDELARRGLNPALAASVPDEVSESGHS